MDFCDLIWRRADEIERRDARNSKGLPWFVHSEKRWTKKDRSRGSRAANFDLLYPETSVSSEPTGSGRRYVVARFANDAFLALLCESREGDSAVRRFKLLRQKKERERKRKKKKTTKVGRESLLETFARGTRRNLQRIFKNEPWITTMNFPVDSRTNMLDTGIAINPFTEPVLVLSQMKFISRVTRK